MSDRHATQLEWMRHLAGELDADESQRLLSHAEQCRACAAECERLEGVQARGRQAAPRLVLPERRRAWRWRLGFALVPAVAAAALLFALVPTDDMRAKGGPRLAMTCKLGTRVWPCQSGEQLEARTAIMFRAELQEQADKTYAMLLGRDGSGRVTRYEPRSSAHARLIEPDEPLMQQSLVIDETPGDEHFYLVTAPQPFGEAQVRSLAEAAEFTHEFGWCHVRHVFFRKRVSQNPPPQPSPGQQ